MSLADKKWAPVPHAVVVAEFLCSEQNRLRQKMVAEPYEGMPSASELARLLDTPDFDNERDNAARFALLNFIRGAVIGQIPGDTAWFEVGLTDNDLGELRVIGRCGWDWGDKDYPRDKEFPRDENELIKVAQRRPRELTADPAVWPQPILWGHTKDGPFTIMEGNNRLVAYAAQPKGGMDVPVLIGLSATRCLWHSPDPLALFADILNK